MRPSASSTASSRDWKDPDQAFATGVWHALHLWDALQLAIDNDWAEGEDGEAAQEELYQELLAQFRSGKKVDQDNLEAILEETLLDVYHTEADDGSIEWLGKLLVTLWNDIMIKKDFTGLNKIMELAKGKAKTQATEVTPQSFFGPGSGRFADALDTPEIKKIENDSDIKDRKYSDIKETPNSSPSSSSLAFSSSSSPSSPSSSLPSLSLSSSEPSNEEEKEWTVVTTKKKKKNKKSKKKS